MKAKEILVRRAILYNKHRKRNRFPRGASAIFQRWAMQMIIDDAFCSTEEDSG